MKIKQTDCPCWPDTSAPVNPCYSRVYDQLVEGKYELTGPWSGWRIKGDGKLYGPNGAKFSPWHLLTLWSLRRELLEAMAADTLNGPTVLKQLHSLRDAVGNAANDDSAGSTLEPTQAFLPGL